MTDDDEKVGIVDFGPVTIEAPVEHYEQPGIEFDDDCPMCQLLKAGEMADKPLTDADWEQMEAEATANLVKSAEAGDLRAVMLLNFARERVRQKYIELDKRYPEIKQYYEDLRRTQQSLLDLHVMDFMWQDEEGTVYKVTEAKGRYVPFERVTVERTRRAGEKSGTLSLTEAREAGFQIEGK